MSSLVYDTNIRTYPIFIEIIENQAQNYREIHVENRENLLTSKV